jgi:hypothetical protein
MSGPKLSCDEMRIVVKPREACVMLACGVTKLYELMNSGELESYLDGASRKITVRSIEALIGRRLAESSKRGVIPNKRSSAAQRL